MPAEDLRRHRAEVWTQVALIVAAAVLTVMLIGWLFTDWSFRGWREGETTLVKVAARLTFSSLAVAFAVAVETLLFRYWLRR